MRQQLVVLNCTGRVSFKGWRGALVEGVMYMRNWRAKSAFSVPSHLGALFALQWLAIKPIRKKEDIEHNLATLWSAEFIRACMDAYVPGKLVIFVLSWDENNGANSDNK